MAEFLKGELESVGASVRLAELGKHTLDGQELPLPPLVLASIGNDKNKRTVVLYGHYDVQPVRMLQNHVLGCAAHTIWL